MPSILRPRSVRRASAGLALLLVTAGATAGAVAAGTPIPPAPERWVTDRAGFLSPGAAAELDRRLEGYQRQSGHQMLVYIDRTTGGVPIEDWAVRAFQGWKVGRQRADDGVVLFAFADDRRLRIEVGYGLEDRIPDAVAKRIIDERITPRIRAGDRDGAIRAGVDAMLIAIGDGAPGATPAQPEPATGAPPVPIPGWMRVAGAVLVLLLLGFLITHPSLAWLLLLSIGSGRGGGGGWRGGGGWGGGGGGGFSGGGGRSGGGGASGGW
jgi:uncharacterized protein